MLSLEKVQWHVSICQETVAGLPPVVLGLSDLFRAAICVETV